MTRQMLAYTIPLTPLVPGIVLAQLAVAGDAVGTGFADTVDAVDGVVVDIVVVAEGKKMLTYSAYC